MLKLKKDLLPSAPHIKQSYNEYIEVKDYKDLVYSIYNDQFKELRFSVDDLPNYRKSTNHWGQRKLLMSEIQFLTLHLDDSIDYVIYVGAAPGKHIPYLVKLFSTIKFVLYDPVDFVIEENEHIEIRKQFFLDRDIDEHVNKNVLFISDIRSGDLRVLGNEFYEQVLQDMKMQMDWCKKLRPKAYMLKFNTMYLRRPDTKDYEYLNGTPYLQMWNGRNSTELRLIGTSTDTKIFDTEQMQKLITYSQVEYRVKYFEHTYKNYGHCFDCAGEIRILEDYFLKTKGSIDKEAIDEMRFEIDRECSSSGRDIFTRIRTEQKDRWFSKRKFNTNEEQVQTLE